MAKQYTPEQIDKVLETLPEELSEALFSVETAEHIWNIREKYNVVDERGNEVPTYVGYVLMGLMLPSEFPQALQKELGIPKKTVEQMARDTNRFIFYPVKPALEKLHSMEMGTKASKESAGGEEAPEKAVEQKTEETPRGEDPYREDL